MRATLFTPTHAPEHLGRLAHSIETQTNLNFEWLIVPNGGVKVSDVVQALGAHTANPRFRIAPYGGETQNIGEIKQWSCAQARGDILIEVDHDDELTPDCVEEVLKAFENPKVDFVYSNCCEVLNDKPFTYSEIYGWTYRPFEWKGLQLLEANSFDPTPASFSKIWYAPNHVRAWKKSFYTKIGGHDKTMDVLDDQDILSRTYIEGVVRKIDKCLYIYHYTGTNTCKGEKNAKIQELTLALHDKYIYRLVERWCDLNGLMKLDLCGGFDSPPGYTSIDLRNGDITADLELPDWPVESGTVGVVRAHDALEHMKDPINTMKEIYRMLAPNGWLLSLTPSSDGRGAFQDPTHRAFFNSNSFWYYAKEQQARYINYCVRNPGETPVKFQLNRIFNFHPSDWHAFHQIMYVKADLLKFDGRVPGMVEI